MKQPFPKERPRCVAELQRSSPYRLHFFYSITALQNKASEAAVDWHTLSFLQLSDLTGRGSDRPTASQQSERKAKREVIQDAFSPLLRLNHIW